MMVNICISDHPRPPINSINSSFPITDLSLLLHPAMFFLRLSFLLAFLLLLPFIARPSICQPAAWPDTSYSPYFQNLFSTANAPVPALPSGAGAQAPAIPFNGGAAAGGYGLPGKK